MPRQARYFLPGYCLHVLARGVNRQRTFFNAEDYGLFMRVVHSAAMLHGCKIHAYVLMTNHVHFLMSPDNDRAVSRVFQAIGRSYVQTLNRKYERTGALWAGRYKSCLVDSDEYLLTCYRYIELNPVRAGLARDPADYPYSSYACNALGRADPVVAPHEVYLALGRDAKSRLAAYRAMFSNVIEERDLAVIRESTDACRVAGSEDFRARVEVETGRRVGGGKRGRPRRHGKDR